MSNIPRISDRFSANARIVLHHGNAKELLATLPSGCIKLIITSPPYNLGKEYEVRVGLRTYLKSQQPVIDELLRVLGDEGSLCWQVGNYVEKGEVFPLDVY